MVWSRALDALLRITYTFTMNMDMKGKLEIGLYNSSYL